MKEKRRDSYPLHECGMLWQCNSYHKKPQITSALETDSIFTCHYSVHTWLQVRKQFYIIAKCDAKEKKQTVNGDK